MRTRAAVLVGRAAELAAATSGRACFLVGEPGVGKSRLITEVSRQTRTAGWVVARGRASSVGPVSPLRPFAEALAGIHRCGLLPDSDLGGYRPLLARVLPELGGPASGEAPPLVAFAEAVLRLLSALGHSAGGCLLVLEDLHAADPDSLAVLEYLLDNTTGPEIALLGALRDEPSDARELLGAAEQRGAAELVPVRPLSRADTDLLVGACLGSDRPAEHICELAWRHTAGNPLAVEELLYHLIDAGQLRQRDDGWQLTAVPALAPPPSTVQLIGSRLGRMDQLARGLVMTAAVYGEQFPLAAIRVALGLDEAGCLAALHDATAAQLMVTERPGWYRFHHPLTHAAVLELTTPVDRRQAASRLAEAILAEDQELTEVTCRTAARLFAQAGQPVRASELYARTGRQALHVGAVELAVADLTEASRLLAPGDRRRPAVISDFAIALVNAGQVDRALAVVVDWGPVAAVPDQRRWALTQLYVAWGYVMTGWMEQAELQLARVRSSATSMDLELVRLHCDALEVCLQAFPPTATAEWIADRAKAVAEAAERLAETAVDPGESAEAAEAACRAWNALVLGLERRDHYREAIHGRQRMLALADRHDLAAWRVAGMRDMANQRWLTDGDELALRAAHDDAQRLGAVYVVLNLKARLAVHQVLVSDGSLHSAVTALTDCADQARRLNYVPGLRWPHAGRVMAAGFRADRPALAEALARQEASGRTPIGAMMAGTASAVCLALEGRDSEALATLKELAERKLLGSYYLSFPLGPLLLLDTMSGAASSEQITQALATSGRMRWTRQFLHWAAAVHAGRSGDREEAQRHAEQAASEADIYPVARHLAARLVAPAAYADGWGNPIEDLRRAEAWFHEQGVSVAARSCRDVLRSLGVAVQQRRTGTASIPAELRAAGVTAREYEVGQLLAEHLSNQAIGERLHISPRTVEKHIAALMSKLAVPDRHAIIDQLIDNHRSGAAIVRE